MAKALTTSRTWHRVVIAVLVSLGIYTSWTNQGASAVEQDRLSQGSTAFARGDYVGAIGQWTQGLDDARRAGDQMLQTDVLVRRAQAYQALGFLSQAITDLTRATELVGPEGKAVVRATLRAGLASVYTRAGRLADARRELDGARSEAARSGDRSLEARVANDLGNLFFAQKLYGVAAEWYRQSAELAVVAGDGALHWTAEINGAYAAYEAGASLSEQLIATIVHGLGELSESSRKSYQLIAVGLLMLQVNERDRQSRPGNNRLAFTAFEQAADTASGIGDRRALSFALGYKAQLYEQAGRYEESLHLTREALFTAQSLAAPEAVYLWQWQIGRIERARGDRPRALWAYQNALATLRSIRADMVAGAGGGPASFERSVRPVILGVADLLLQSADEIANSAALQAQLNEARRTVELLKAAELEDYFHDNCVAALRAKEQEIDELASATAALYPIILPDRLELLITLPGGLSRVTVPVPSDEIEPIIRDFRRKLEKRTTRQYLGPGQVLHDWLIAPIAADLEANAVTTLVIVPSGLLSTISFAALHDGEQHLIERLAVAVAPGLRLVKPRPIEQEMTDVLAGGLTRSVEGFAPLPQVETELQNLASVFEASLFKDEAFLTEKFEEELAVKPYTIVHVASHARFEAESKDSFLLTFDGRLTMDGLEQFVKLSRFREDPVELLTLSACSTAMGDQRAALGLAGVGIKAGARSVLASLWFINDESTSVLISSFYEHLKRPDTSKAEALRRAQLQLLADSRLRHPAYWAAFLMIGSWL